MTLMTGRDAHRWRTHKLPVWPATARCELCAQIIHGLRALSSGGRWHHLLDTHGNHPCPTDDDPLPEEGDKR